MGAWGLVQIFCLDHSHSVYMTKTKLGRPEKMVTCNENHAGMLQGIFDYGHILYQAKIFQTNGILDANFETETDQVKDIHNFDQPRYPGRRLYLLLIIQN